MCRPGWSAAISLGQVAIVVPRDTPVSRPEPADHSECALMPFDLRRLVGQTVDGLPDQFRHGGTAALGEGAQSRRLLFGQLDLRPDHDGMLAK